MSTPAGTASEWEKGGAGTRSTNGDRGDVLRKSLRCSVCGGSLPAGTPIGNLVWDPTLRRFRHAQSCVAARGDDKEPERTAATNPEQKPTPQADGRDPRRVDPSPEALPPPEVGPAVPVPQGPDTARDWARVGFTLRLGDFESLRAEVALYAGNGEDDASFTERLRESLVLKAQETLAAVHEVREWIGKQSASP
jgi:hypothetical protein